VPEYRINGIGMHLLRSILSKADLLSKNVTLRFLKNNPVKSLYVRNGFRVVHTDDIPHYMERKPGAGNNSL
jgi:ribosomal protein S18 acetylase RimI-like enzyme